MLWFDNERKDSFYEYIETVYGEIPNILFKYYLDIIYSRANVQFRFQDSFKSIKYDLFDGHIQKHITTFSNIDYENRRGHQDNDWVEVTRGSTLCHINNHPALDGLNIENKKKFENNYYEGYSRGWPGDEGFDERKPQPYGCWFYIVRGTGVYINIGKTIVANSTSNAMQILDLPCLDPPNCYSGQNDFDICRKVIEKGYDSIQIFNSRERRVHELVYCSGNCSSQPVRGACPPIQLRTGWNATKKCDCNDLYPVVNCNNKITDIVDCRHINPPEERVKHTCYFEDFNWNNAFESSWDGSIAIFILWDRNGTQTLPKLKTVINTHQQGGWSTIAVDSGLQLDQAANRPFVLDVMNYVGVDIVPVFRKSEYATLNRHKFKFKMLSLTVPGFLRSTVVKRAGVKIGFISYILHSMENSSLDEMAQLVLDEALCLKRTSDIVVLLSASEIIADIHISKKVHKFVDMIVGGNAEDHINCNDKWHKNSDSVIIHSKHDDTYLTMISIDVVDKNKFSFKSNILDLSSIKEDGEVRNWLDTKGGNIINYFNPDNVGGSVGNYFSKYFYALGLSITEQRDFYYDMQDEYAINEKYIPTQIKFKNDKIFSKFIQDMDKKFINENITSDYLRTQEGEKMWFIEDNKHIIFWNISKPIIQQILSNMFSKMKLNVTVEYPVIHFRCGDVPFERHYAYHFVKYSFYKEALNIITKKGNKKYSEVLILSCSSHRATGKSKEYCNIYTQSLKAYLESIGYEVNIQCNNIIEDFAKLYYSVAAISSVSSYSFIGGFFGEGQFVSSEYNYEYNTEETCTICDDWMIKGYQVKHKFIPDYDNTSSVIQILN